jgi:hypothetical protein
VSHAVIVVILGEEGKLIVGYRVLCKIAHVIQALQRRQKLKSPAVNAGPIQLRLIKVPDLQDQYVRHLLLVVVVGQSLIEPRQQGIIIPKLS